MSQNLEIKSIRSFYAQDNKFVVDEFIEIKILSKKEARKRKIEVLFEKLKRNDILICTYQGYTYFYNERAYESL